MTNPSSITRHVEDIAAGQPEGRASEAFARASRHTRRVRILKIVLPVVAIMLAVGFFAATYISSPSGLGFQLGSTSVEGGKLVMDNPKLDGFTDDNRPYSMSAARASQTIGDTNRIDLETILARLPLDTDDWVSVEATTGTFDRQANQLEITGEMRVSTQSGINALLRSATINVDEGNLITQDPVEIDLDGGRITADSMQIVDDGAVMIFEQRVRMRIEGEKVQATARSNGETQ